MPLTVATVLPSYVLLFATIPVMPNDFGVISADKPAGCADKI